MREKHATTTLTINAPNSILDHKDLIGQFLKATENDPCPEEIEKEMKAAGIAPDRSFIQKALSEYGKSSALQASRYIELARRDRSDQEEKELYELGRKLTAKGLDPKHSRSLMERATILDNKKAVQGFLKAAENRDELLIKFYGDRLKRDTGIRPDARSLERALTEIAQNAKAAEKLKCSTRSRSRQLHKPTAKGLDPKRRDRAKHAAILDNGQAFGDFMYEAVCNRFEFEKLMMVLKKLGFISARDDAEETDKVD
ncbi:MAG: hypothetical protein K6F57_02295 [Candidatus Saccharibacteria bacterium]|nr:hypothetical protein [Candidatus Saccharibacteria bacterium]